MFTASNDNAHVQIRPLWSHVHHGQQSIIPQEWPPENRAQAQCFPIALHSRSQALCGNIRWSRPEQIQRHHIIGYILWNDRYIVVWKTWKLGSTRKGHTGAWYRKRCNRLIVLNPEFQQSISISVDQKKRNMIPISLQKLHNNKPKIGQAGRHQT